MMLISEEYADRKRVFTHIHIMHISARCILQRQVAASYEIREHDS
jgi:hypothetical protein